MVEQRLVRSLRTSGEFFVGTVLAHAALQYGLNMHIFALSQTLAAATSLAVLGAAYTFLSKQ